MQQTEHKAVCSVSLRASEVTRCAARALNNKKKYAYCALDS